MEESLLKWLEFGDSLQKLDVYNKKFRARWFKIFYNISKNMQFSEYLYYLFMVVFFAQIIEINIGNYEIGNDKVLKISKYLEKILLFEKIINSEKTHNLILIISMSFFIFSILLEFLNIIFLFAGKSINVLSKIYSFIVVLYAYYLSGPIFHIFFVTVLIQLKEKFANCDIIDYVKFIFCFLFTIILIFNVIIISFYMDDINTINECNHKSKINNRYTTLIMIIKLIYFFLDQLIYFILEPKDINNYIYQIIFVILNLCISFYTYKNVYYYNNTIDTLHHFGWYFTTWFSICILFKNLSKTKDITLFVIIGIILIGFSSYFNKNYKIFKLLTEFNILSGNDLKDIEIYSNLLFFLSHQNNPRSKTLFAGIIKKSEESLKNNPELYEIYNKYITKGDEHKLFSSNNELKALSLIGTVYVNSEEKSDNKIDISLNRCYFLINKCKNLSLAVHLATKINANNHMHAYYKYVLLEEIKEYLINKLNKSRKKLSMKNVQLSSVILYSQLLDLFKIEIYDATCSQIEYFDILKNNVSTEKTTENFLKTGENILSLRKNILDIWNKMIELNPVDMEAEKDYLIYLDVILQDEFLKKEEIKKYKLKKADYLTDKKNFYFDIFNQEKNAVLLCDGYSFNGKIFYYTPNFASLFGFTGKEISNISIDDLIPDSVQSFHKYLLEENTKYTNLMTIFKAKRTVLLKGKNGLLFNVYIYLRIIPNLQYGLLFILYIQKNFEKNFMIVLDSKLHIDGFTEGGQTSLNFTMNNAINFGLSQFIIGYHIGLIIPDIIFQIDYDIKKGTYFLRKENIDLKGFFYPSHNSKELNIRINKILEIIKNNKLKENDEDNNEKINVFDEYNDFIKEIQSQNKKSFSIFYRIECRSFLEGKYKYYKIYITNDLLSENLNDLTSKEKNNLISNTDNNIKESISIIDNQAKNQDKLIKLKIKKSILKNKKINNDEENTGGNNKNENSKDINYNQNQINFSQPTSSTSSILSKANRESNEFHKLKNEIINKKDFFNIKLIKYLAAFYILIIIGLIAYDFVMTKKIINSLDKFLRENLYFDHTKIACANAYNTGLNLRLIRKNIINIEDCPNSNCTLFYSDLLKKSYTEIRILKYDLNAFYQEFQDIFNKKLMVLSKRYQSDSEYIPLDIDNYLNFLIASGLKAIANLTNYYGNGTFFAEYPSYEIIDNYLDNLLYSSYSFFNSNFFKGFEGKEKTKLLNKYSNNFPKRLIIALFCLVLVLGLIIYLDCKIHSTECFFLDKLINFNSPNFDEYLKRLEELKKTLRDENNDDEDKNMDDEIEEDLDGKEDNNSINKNKDKDMKLKLFKKKDSSKKKKNKQNKLHLQKLKKRKNMSEHFFRINLFFVIKICITFSLLIIYFIVTIILFSNYKNNFIEFDKSLEHINKIYLNIFKTFLLFKRQIESADANIITNEIEIPNDSNLTQAKLGNALFNIIYNSKYSEDHVNKIKILYNENACQILVPNGTDDKYCEILFSSILVKGLDQAIVQMGIIINNCIDELTALKMTKNLTIMYSRFNYYYNYELLVGYYIFNSFLITKDAFSVFRDDEKNYIFNVHKALSIVYIVFVILVIMLCCYYIYIYKKEGNSFWNFIGILPNKFISDDENFYDSVIKLGELLY